MWNCNITRLLSAEEMDAYLFSLTGTFSEAAPKSGDLRALPNHSLRGVYGGALAHWDMCHHAPTSQHSLQETIRDCHRCHMSCEHSNYFFLVLNQANNLINKRRIYYLNAHRREIHTAGRWTCSLPFSSAVWKEELKQHDRLFGVLFIIRTT